MELLEIKELSKNFGNIKVIDKVSLTVEKGSVVGLVGDNGAGKSTLMKIITGIHKPCSGSVLLEGQNITSITTSKIRLLGIEMIYQDLALARQQDISSNIFLGREPVKKIFGINLGLVDKKKMDEDSIKIIKDLGANVPSVKYQAGLLSGGQQQTIAIARALTFSPKLVIMDEPTAALAVKEVQHVLDLILKLKSDGISVILISHRLNDIFDVSDRIIVLRQGQIVAEKIKTETSMNQIVSYIVGAE
ncbi:MAG: sugar ABC transporter ATP-binding protein [Nitrospina sp.]|jgi:ABC-type sugar transport system ATPase subunit|nr:sugar ABC transporter ATP-binding protein [Nitrospina sp.]MBT4661438.1 sugar ABC transporter ATP-binding protein [Candidatus Neomarinimicrobiota bacterium]